MSQKVDGATGDGCVAIKGDTFLVTLRGGIYKSISHLPKLLSIYMKNSKK